MLADVLRRISMTGVGIKSVQTGIATLRGRVDVTIQPVELAKTFVISGQYAPNTFTTNDTGSRRSFETHLQSSTLLSFEHEGSGPTLYVPYTVVELSGAAKVQQVRVTTTALNVSNAMITQERSLPQPVDLSRSFLIATGRASAGTPANIPRVWLLDESRLRAQVSDAYYSSHITAFVIEIGG